MPRLANRRSPRHGLKPEGVPFAKTQKCPFFYFSDLIIGETTCDGKKKMYEYLGQFKPV